MNSCSEFIYSVVVKEYVPSLRLNQGANPGKVVAVAAAREAAGVTAGLVGRSVVGGVRCLTWLCVNGRFLPPTGSTRRVGGVCGVVGAAGVVLRVCLTELSMWIPFKACDVMSERFRGLSR